LYQRPHGYWLILVSFLVAFVLAVLPMPLWLQWARPEWVALTLIYWTIALPHRVGILTGLLLGVLLDSLEGALLGQNAFALVVVALLSVTLYQRLRVYSLWQQAGTVFVLVGINQLVCQWVQNLEGVGARSTLFLLPAVSSALLWPVVLHTLRRLRRYYMVT
jgi:rod shape-determining protein MreD